MTGQSDLQAARRRIKLQSDGLKKVTELDHVFASIQQHDCGEPQELINNQQEPTQRPTRHVWGPADCFIEAVCEAASSHNSGFPPILRRPPSCFAHFVVLWQILIKDADTCALHVPRDRIREDSGKNILAQVQKVTAPYR